MLVSFPVDRRVNDPDDCAEIETCPGVPPVVALEKRMMLEAVHAVVLVAIVPGVPDMASVTPTEALDPAAIESLLPAVPNTRFPFVAVIAPKVAVRVVVAVRDPVTAVFPVALPILVAPVPPVPIEVTPAPEVLMLLVPVAVIPPVVATSPVAAVIVVVEAIEPGAMKVEGAENVTVDPEAAVVISLAVPANLRMPRVGVADPESPSRVEMSPEFAARDTHTATPPATPVRM